MEKEFNLTEKKFLKIEGIRFIIIMVILVTLFTECLKVTTVPSISMIPTLKVGTLVVSEVHFKELEYEDIVIFTLEKPVTGFGLYGELKSKFSGQTIYIKRVLGKGGDEVRIVFDGPEGKGTLYRNGVEVECPYVPDVQYNRVGAIDWIMDRTCYEDGREEYSITVPEDCLFLMGDNRNMSYDSRYFGCVPQSYVLGRAVFYFTPINLGIERSM